MNIIDYLDARNNISLEEDSFNEVDGLVLAELVYTKFDTILDSNSNEDIKIVNDRFWQKHTKEEILSSSSYTKYAPILLEKMATGKRFKGTRLKHYISKISLKDYKQFAAITIELPDGSEYIAFRGTDGTVAGWMEDLKFSYSLTDGQYDAKDYLNTFHINNKRRLRIGGHSKGANLAVFAAMYCDKSIQNNIDFIYSYDGPGFSKEIVDSKEYMSVLNKVISIVPKDCTIGIMMYNKFNSIITDSDNYFVFQHDGFAWHIVDNHFEELPSRSYDSLFFEKVLKNWLENFDEYEREKMMEIIFSQIENCEDEFKDNEKFSTAFIYSLLLHSPKLDDNQKDLLINSIKDFVLSTKEVSYDEIKTRADALLQKLELEFKEKIDVTKLIRKED